MRSLFQRELPFITCLFRQGLLIVENSAVYASRNLLEIRFRNPLGRIVLENPFEVLLLFLPVAQELLVQLDVRAH